MVAVSVILRAVAGFLLIAHGLVHLLYLAPDVPEFSVDDSWLVPPSATRQVAVALMAATIVTFALLGMAVWGVPVLNSVWPALTLVAVAASTVLLAAFWDWRLLFGIALNAALVAVVVLRPAWAPQLGS